MRCRADMHSRDMRQCMSMQTRFCLVCMFGLWHTHVPVLSVQTFKGILQELLMIETLQQLDLIVPSQPYQRLSCRYKQ